MPERPSNEILEKVKISLRVSNGAFDEELTDLIQAALMDLGIAGVTEDSLEDRLILRAVTTYCKVHFGEPSDREWLKQSYDEQKAQLRTATRYTDWGDADGQE